MNPDIRKQQLHSRRVTAAGSALAARRSVADPVLAAIASLGLGLAGIACGGDAPVRAGR